MSAAPLLEPRLEPPPAREGIVARAALAERLCPSAQATVATVVAPAGYGKTTLLAEVAASGDLPVAWLTVHETDNEPAVFLRHVAVAVGWAVGLDEPPSTPARLRRALRAGPPIRIVLDDLQTLENGRCLEIVQTLATDLPPRAQLLLASRAPIALDRQERLVELGAGDLRMSAGEAALLLRGAGVNAPDEVVAALTARLEGWPTGLYLAALAHQVEGQDLSSFGGADRYVHDYFREECLAGLEAEGRALSRARLRARAPDGPPLRPDAPDPWIRRAAGTAVAGHCLPHSPRRGRLPSPPGVSRDAPGRAPPGRAGDAEAPHRPGRRMVRRAR